jgi:hypothetical protein
MNHQRRLHTLLTSILIGLVITVATPLDATAVDLDIDALTQQQFKDLSEEVGLAISYVAAAPAEPLGFPHFDIGVEATVTTIDSDASYWQTAFNGDPPDFLVVPKLRARIGLPLGIDLGAIYATIPYVKVNLIGGEVKWALLRGGVTMPAVAIRGAYTTLLGVDELKMETYSADLSISKGFTIFTPYAGVGQIWSRAQDKSSGPTLNTEQHSNTRGFVGLQIGIPLVRFVIEAAFLTVQSYTARLSVGF